MFAGMLFFVALQLAVNAKRGMVFSPFYHFGMYAAPVKPVLSYPIATITVGNDTLRGSDFSPQGWDKIQYNLYMVWKSRCDTAFYQDQVFTLLHKYGLRTPPKSLYVNNLSFEERLENYKNTVGRLTGKIDSTITISRTAYRYYAGKFLPLQELLPIPEISELCR